MRLLDWFRDRLLFDRYSMSHKIGENYLRHVWNRTWNNEEHRYWYESDHFGICDFLDRTVERANFSRRHYNKE